MKRYTKKYEHVRVQVDKNNRAMYADMKPGDRLVALGEEGQGLALCKEADFMAGVEAVMAAARRVAK